MVNDILSGIPWEFSQVLDWSCIFYFETSIIKGFRAAIVEELFLGDIVFMVLP
jgi:hypothetical protein